MSKSRKQQEEDKAHAHALAKLRALLAPGDTVYTILRHVSRSGQTRIVDAYVIAGGELFPVGWAMARVLGKRFDAGHQGIRYESAFQLVRMAAWVIFEHDPRLQDWARERIANGLPAHPTYALTQQAL